MPNVSKSERLRDPEPEPREHGAKGATEAERELVRRAQKGDAGAYEELVRNHQRRVLSVVARVLRGREDLEDIAQQVFIKAYFSLKRFDLRSTFSTWLYKIAVNECWDYLRKKRVRPLIYEADLSEEQAGRLEAIDPPNPAPVDALQALEQRELVERLLDELSEQDRMILVLKEVEGFAVDEISKILGLNPNTVKVRLFRARGRLGEIYRQQRQRPRSQRR